VTLYYAEVPGNIKEQGSVCKNSGWDNYKSVAKLIIY
jgi:hypothetical protein